MKRRLVALNDEPLVDWVSEPVFRFDSEVDALQMLERLGDELRVARTQVDHVMRYLGVAVRTAAEVREDGEPITVQAMIGHSGLARQTVYNLLQAEG